MFNRNVFNNAKWIIGCKIIQSLIQLIVGMLTARYLGPSNYGLINYAAAVVAFAVPVMQLGLQSTLVQEYVERPKEEGQTLGTDAASVLGQLVDLLACKGGSGIFGNDSANASAGGDSIGEYAESAGLDCLGKILDDHVVAGVGLVATVIVHRFGKGETG